MGFSEGRPDNSPATYRDIKEIKKKIKEYNSQWASFLGAMAVVVVLGRVWSLNYQIGDLEKKVEELHPQLQVEDVVGETTLDKFYVIEGDTVYLEVDGRLVGEYFRR